MKRILLLSFNLMPVVLLAQDGKFTLKVTAHSAPAEAYLIYKTPDKFITDSTVAEKGVFIFKGLAPEPVRAQLVLDHKHLGLARLGPNADVLNLYLEQGSINVIGKDSVKTALITGSTVNNEDKKYQAAIASSQKAIMIVNNDYYAASDDKKKDQAFTDGLQARFDAAQKEYKTAQMQYIRQNPDSYISLLALQDFAGQDIDVSTVEPLYKSLSASVRNSVGGIAFSKAIDAARATSIGAIAPNFTQNDVNDKPVSLTDFKGKYVLLDFWASWCGPCRGENPNVVRAYKQYKNKNFTVLSVSLDRPGKKDEWLAAIKADGLEWTQVSDLNFWNNAVAKLYGITFIPKNYLIDPSGKIIAKNLRGDDLDQKLAELFK